MICQDIIKNLSKVFGHVSAYVYVIEFQKRGLPHMHLLATLAQPYTTPEEIDRYISAEIPDKEKHPNLYKIVMTNMLHGPHTKDSMCLKSDEDGELNICEGTCAKGFPKTFIEATDMTGDGFPKYRRSDNVHEQHVYNPRSKRGLRKHVDNSMVVPYNPYLLQKYNCHVNVEFCASVRAIKYIYKYITKGHDRGCYTLSKGSDGEVTSKCVNEIQNYIDGRSVGATEASWRLLNLALNGRSHPVEMLPVHLSGQNLVTFTENNEMEAVRDRTRCTTKLTAWLALNNRDPDAREYTYPEIPNHYIWDDGVKMWKRRARSTKMLSRLIAVSPKDFERFCLKILLRKTPGAKTYEELRTFEGEVYETFGEVTHKRMLLGVENEEFDIMDDAASFMMPKQLREFFISLVLTSTSANSGLLYEKFKDALGDGLTREECLNEFENILLHENMSCLKIGLPSPANFKLIKPADRVPYSEHNKIFVERLNSMNGEQRDILESIITEIESGKQVLSFIDGPGGTGKTYLYNALYHKLRSLKKTVVLLAWTGLDWNCLDPTTKWQDSSQHV